LREDSGLRRSRAQLSTQLPIPAAASFIPARRGPPPLRAGPAAANNAGMTVADAPDAEQRQRLIHINQRQVPGGHVHMVTADRPSWPVGPVPGQPPPGQEPTEPAQQLGPDIKAVLGSLTRHVARLESDNDRLRRDNDRLRAQVNRLRSQLQAIGGQVQALGGQVARQVGELLASTGD
jgi:Homeobox associated leucine zipper